MNGISVFILKVQKNLLHFLKSFLPGENAHKAYTLEKSTPKLNHGYTLVLNSLPPAL